MTLSKRNHLHRILLVAVLGLLLLPQPLMVLSTTTDTTSTALAYIEPLLIEEMNSRDSKIPIIIHLSEEIDEFGIDWLVERQIPQDTIIRHVFSDMKMISAYASSKIIKTLASMESIDGITLDKKWSISEIPIDSTEYEAKDEIEYIHSDKYMYADDLWMEGYNGSGVTVAVIDSGVDPDHPDLAGRIIGFKDYIGDSEDLDPIDGIDAYDDNGHGTACAWLVAGSGVESNGTFSGMAPGADLLIIKVLDSTGAGDDSKIAQGINFARDNGADIISLSLGGTWIDGLFAEPSAAACKNAVEAGVIVMVAAGNSGPAAYTITSPGITEEVITVGSSVRNTSVVTFSSRGPVVRDVTSPNGVFPKPDILAPGREVVSGRASGVNPFEYPVYDFLEYGASYTSWSGTSASCPQIAGLAALLLNKHGSVDPIVMKAALMISATDIGEDPMAQGWGLANASKASEYLVPASPEITILSPNRYPTLPGGSSIMIVGEDREPSNITIISTHNVGLCDIEITGNVSQFLQLNDESVLVDVGYNYFSLGIEMPSNIAIADIGLYSGELSIKSGASSIATMNLEILLTTYGGGLLVDMTHHELAYPNADPDYPDQYRYFQQYLKEQGMILSEFGVPNPYVIERISESDLDTIEVFMIMDTELSYTTTEIEAIHDFVENGGTLLILSEFYNSTTGQASFGLETYNDILEPFGIQCEQIGIGVPVAGLGSVYGPNTTGAVEPSPLTDGVNGIYVLAGSTLSVDESKAEGLFWADNNKQHAIIAYAEYGEGQVIAVSDGSTLYDDILFDAIQSGADNLQLLRNIAREIIPDRPRLYDVEIIMDRIGSPGNITAYIFDEDLVSVNMTVTTQQGIIIEGDVLQSQGYKYYKSFIVESGGFYTVNIEIADSEGNHRILEKLVLVQGSLVEDLVFITVLWSLLGVVAIGLGYVGVKRFAGGRRKSRRRVESEWEPEWESDSRPPSIE